MNSDVRTLQSIAATLEEEPMASQRVLAENAGKNKLALYGKSYIRFLLIYACQILNITFIEKEIDDSLESDALCVIGELSSEEDIERMRQKGCLNLLDLINERENSL